jgi:uncharacterized protein (TIGR00375 family)
MRVISDFHIHSRFSRATSKQLSIPNLVKYAKIKGLNLLGTGDFTHPEWLKEIKSHMSEDGSGIMRTGEGFPFILQTEVSLIYSQGGKGRRIHHVLLAPDLETVSQINEWLLTRGRLDYDGRPIFGFDSIELVEKLKSINPRNEVIPAHAWTPWFGALGSKSGFDSIGECFGDQVKHIHALETGLSSDPEMNWRLSSLDRFSLVSNSDSHSFWPWRIGREANVFEMDKLTYDGFIRTMRERDPKRFLYTIEVDPNYGKYHFDGHRNCNVRMSPEDSRKHKGICPVCRKPLTIGVLNRVEELADREEGFRPKGAVPFRRLIPLSEVIAAYYKTSLVASKKVWAAFNSLTEGASELEVLLNLSREEIARRSDERLASYIISVREGSVYIQPGYDGEYGYPVFEGKDKTVERSIVPKKEGSQKSIMDFQS